MKTPKLFKSSKLPKLRNKKSKNKNGAGNKYANPVFDEWKEFAAKEFLIKQTRSHVIKRCLACLVFLGIVVASTIFTGHYVSFRKAEINNVISRGNSLLNEYGKVITDLETYERYAKMKPQVPLYVQFAAITSSSKLGFFVDSLSFEQDASLGNLRESFVVKTGQNANAVKVLGMWKIKGLLMQRVDNRWTISFEESLENMFFLFGMKSYVSTSLRDTDMEATVILYE